MGKMIVVLQVFLLLGIIPMGCSDDKEDKQENSDSGSGGDGDTGTDSDSDSDADSESPGDSESNSDIDEIPPNMLVLPEGASPSELYGDAEVQLVESDFGAETVDFTLDGMYNDLPDPTYDCTDEMVTNTCISYVVDLGTGDGEFYEYLWIGDEEVGVGSVSMPMAGYGVFTMNQPPLAADINVFVEQWVSTPDTFSESMVQGYDSPTIYISANFDDFDGGRGSTNGTVFIEAKINGWAAHTTDYGNPENTVMVAAFAASWTNRHDNVVRFRGTLKGYFTGIDIKK